MERTEKVYSHLDPERQKLKLEKTKIKSKKAKTLQGHTSPKPLLEPTNNVETQETTRKKKKRRKDERPDDYNTESEREASVKSTHIVSSQDSHGDHEIMKIKKKKKHKLHDSQESEESESTKGHKHKAQEMNCDSIFVWDSHIKDGYKRLPSIPCANKKAQLAWDGTAKSGVVEQLLKSATNKAYGMQVFSWDGEKSTVSQDAEHDAEEAKHNSVIDEWDEDFDSGKVKKIKFKRDKFRINNSFQYFQNRRNFWSVTQQGNFSRFPSRF